MLVKSKWLDHSTEIIGIIENLQIVETSEKKNEKKFTRFQWNYRPIFDSVRSVYGFTPFLCKLERNGAGNDKYDINYGRARAPKIKFPPPQAAYYVYDFCSQHSERILITVEK